MHDLVRSLDAPDPFITISLAQAALLSVGPPAIEAGQAMREPQFTALFHPG
jgi:hypothetical protein